MWNLDNKERKKDQRRLSKGQVHREAKLIYKTNSTREYLNMGLVYGEFHKQKNFGAIDGYENKRKKGISKIFGDLCIHTLF